MKIKLNRWLFMVFLVFLWGISSAQAAVPLQAKINYMEKLKKEAVILKNQGYYDKSIEKSQKVQILAGEIDATIKVLKKWYLLQRNIAVAKQVGANKTAAEEFNKAVEFYKAAEQAFVDDDIEQAKFNIDEGLYYIEIAIEKARKNFDERNKNNEEKIASTHDVELQKLEAGEYVVRLIPQRRDSLWRIAEYDFIYDNPWLWKRIYEANKDIIDDPDLIYPDQKLVIPPLPYNPELE